MIRHALRCSDSASAAGFASRARPRRGACSVRTWSATCVVVLLTIGCKKSTPPPVDSNSPSSAIPSVERVPPELADRALAKVGERVITVSDYAAVLDRMDRFERMRYQTPERRKALLEELINTELLAREAERRGLDKRPEAQAYVNQLLADEVRRRLRATLPAPEQLPAEEVQAYYAAHRDAFKQPERRRVALITVASLAAGKKVLAELQTDGSVETWNALSRKHHVLAPPAGALPVAVLGDEGFTALDEDPAASKQLSPAIKKAAFAAPATGGVYPEVVEDGGAYHVVRVTTVAPAHLLTIEEADALVRSRLIEQKLTDLEVELQKLLEKGAPLEINEAVLSRLKRAKP